MKYKVGQTVKVVNSGNICSTYDGMAKELGATKYEHGWGYEKGKIDFDGELALVKKQKSNHVLIYLGKYDKEVVMQLGGIEPVTVSSLPESFCVHTPTQKEYDRVVKKLEEMGNKRWGSFDFEEEYKHVYKSEGNQYWLLHHGHSALKREKIYSPSEFFKLVGEVEEKRYTGELKEGMKVSYKNKPEEDPRDKEGTATVYLSETGELMAKDERGLSDHLKKSSERWDFGEFWYISHVISTPEEKEDPERYSYKITSVKVDGETVPWSDFKGGINVEYVPINISPQGGLEKLMSALRTIPARLKRVMDKTTRYLFEIGWIEGDLNPTSEGRQALNDYLWDLHKNDKEFIKLVEAKRRELKKKNDDEEDEE